MKGNTITLPENAPKVGEVYRHYKGDSYEVVERALHSNEYEWMMVYKPLYKNPDADLFTRPMREWNDVMEWPVGSGESHTRFTLVK